MNTLLHKIMLTSALMSVIFSIISRYEKDTESFAVMAIVGIGFLISIIVFFGSALTLIWI